MSQVYFEDVSMGDEIGPMTKEPTREQLDAFMKVWGGGPSRFTSDEVARTEGFTGVIIPGHMSMALLAQLLTSWKGSAGKLKSLEVNFRRYLQPGDHYSCKGVITDTEVVDGENRVTLDVYIENQKGERAQQGTAIVILPSK
ncbi:MAG: Acyl dehydratase [Dehalococcoidia bacterium]|nr:Acyl dehydratase [Dehalococcoidia bacterium]